jgi:hypothetical protein
MDNYGFTQNGFVVDTFGFSQKAGGGCDPAALAFIAAAGITNAVQKGAICQLVSDLMSTGVWSSLNAIYPFVGGSATTHRYNLKNPTTYQITWFGGVTHSANGVTFNGINSYGNTGYNESLIETSSNTHRSVYDRSTSADFRCQIGVANGPYSGSYQRNYIYTNYSSNYYMDCYDNLDNYGRLAGANGGSNAFWLHSRTSSASGGMKAYKNGAFLKQSTHTVYGIQPTLVTYIGALNLNGSLHEPTNHNLALASMGTGLTGVQVANYYSAVQAFQTTLGRQV